MRIYCDSNIFRKAKKTSNQFNVELFNSLESIKEVVIFLFSEAHLDDLSKSKEDYRNEDLKLMESYVKNNYISWNHTEKNLGFILATPIQAYNSMDFTASEKLFRNPNEYIQNLFDEVGKDSTFYKALFDIPVFSLNNIDISNIPKEYQELFTEIKSIRSINDALKHLINASGFINNPTNFRKQQKLLSTFIDRDSYSYEQWSMDFNNRMKDTEFGKSFTELLDMTILDSEKQDDYTYFIKTYISLESFGVTEERSGRKRKIKRNSFSDLYRDASHAFYGSKSDCFVTDDIGAQTKAFIVYKLFNINTQVLSPKDFIAKAPFILKNEDDSQSFFDGLSLSLKKGMVLHQTIVFQQQVIKSLYPIFNYFDRIQLNGTDGSIQLFKSRESYFGIMYAEIKLLIEKCNKIFGPPLEINGDDRLIEIANYNEEGPMKNWKVGNLNISVSWEPNNYNEKLIVLKLGVSNYNSPNLWTDLVHN